MKIKNLTKLSIFTLPIIAFSTSCNKQQENTEENKTKTNKNSSSTTNTNKNSGSNSTVAKPNKDSGNNTKPNTEPKIDINKEKIIELFNLDHSKTASEAVKQLKNIKINELIISSLNIENVDDNTGSLTISINGKYKNNNFSFKNLKINGFSIKKKNTFNFKNNAKLSLNIDKLIDEKKNFKNIVALSNDDLLPYIDKLLVLNEDNEYVDVKNMINKELKITSLKIIQKNSKYVFNLTLSKNNSTVVEAFNNVIDENDYSFKKILDYIIDKTEISTVKQDNFASYYSTRSNDFKQLTAKFLTIKDKYEQYFKAFGFTLFVSINNVSANDFEGKLFINYSLKAEKNTEELESTKSKHAELKLFSDKTKMNEILDKEIQINVNSLNEANKNIKKDLEQIINEYNALDETKKETYEVPAAKAYRVFKILSIPFAIIKEANNNEFSINKTKNWVLTHNGVDFDQRYDTHTGLLDYDNSHDSGLQIRSIQMSPISINGFKTYGTGKYLNLNFKLSFFLNKASSTLSSNEESIEFNKTISFKYD